MSVTVVLDTGAVLAYPRGSIALGELLTIVADDEDTVVIPVACLAEAHRRSSQGEQALLNVLSAVPCVEVVPLVADHAAEIGILSHSSSGIDVGHAVVEAIAYHAQVATSNAGVIGRLLPDDWPVIEI